MNGVIKGILKIQRHYDGGGGPGKMHSRLTVVFLVEEDADQPHAGVSTCKKHWLTEKEMAHQPKFLIDMSTQALLRSVVKNEPVYPCEVVECVKPRGEVKIEKRRESEQIGERPQLVRAKSLEDQMLQQSGYGTKGVFTKPSSHSCECSFSLLELKQIEDKFVSLCGSVHSLMKEGQFSTMMVHLGFNPSLCQQCFKYALNKI